MSLSTRAGYFPTFFRRHDGISFCFQIQNMYTCVYQVNERKKEGSDGRAGTDIQPTGVRIVWLKIRRHSWAL